jgi:ribA/ribD-fused uncharacterized protein
MTRRADRFTFFFRPESPFSQWHPARFTLGGHIFNCAEQYMMYGKAPLFGDAEMAAKILEAASPRQHKALGRNVRHFAEPAWKAQREQIVADGNRAKFTQNPELRQALLDTAGTQLVEASPFDRIWGIGLAAGDRRADDPSQWRGQNLLGKILTRVRDELLAA